MDLSLVSNSLIVAVLVAISLGALLKGMTGLGLPLFAVPAIASVTSVEDAVVLMIIPGIAANLWLVFSHRKHHLLLREHVPFLVTGFAGGLVGTWLLQSVSDQILKLLLVIGLGLYLVQYFFSEESLLRFRPGRRAGYVLGLAAGTVQGASGISAQIVAPYYHARGLVLEAYAFIVAFTFLFFSIAQFAAMANLQLLTPDRIQLSLLALIPTLVFTWVGIRVSSRISIVVFNKILLVMFVVMELKLIMDIL